MPWPNFARLRPNDNSKRYHKVAPRPALVGRTHHPIGLGTQKKRPASSRVRVFVFGPSIEFLCSLLFPRDVLHNDPVRSRRFGLKSLVGRIRLLQRSEEQLRAFGCFESALRFQQRFQFRTAIPLVRFQ